MYYFYRISCRLIPTVNLFCSGDLSLRCRRQCRCHSLSLCLSVFVRCSPNAVRSYALTMQRRLRRTNTRTSAVAARCFILAGVGRFVRDASTAFLLDCETPRGRLRNSESGQNGPLHPSTPLPSNMCVCDWQRSRTLDHRCSDEQKDKSKTESGNPDNSIQEAHASYSA